MLTDGHKIRCRYVTRVVSGLDQMFEAYEYVVDLKASCLTFLTICWRHFFDSEMFVFHCVFVCC